MTAPEPIPPSLQSFITKFIGSVEQLEILCLLIKNQDRPWSVPEVFRVIRSSERSIAQCLAEFCHGGLVVAAGPDTFAFAPQGEHAPVALELCQTYETRRVTIVEMIYSRTSDRLQHFADAFRLRKDP